MLSDRKDAQLELASNAEVRKYVHSDGEALLMAVSAYVLLLETGRQQDAEEFLAMRSKSGQLGVAATLAHLESRDFALNLYKLGYMGHTTAFTSKWIRDNILDVYGGVSKSKPKDETMLTNVFDLDLMQVYGI